MKPMPLILFMLTTVLGSGLVTALLASANLNRFSQSDVTINNHSKVDNCLQVNKRQKIDKQSQTYIINTPILNLVKQNSSIKPMSDLDFYCRGTENFLKKEYSQAIENYTKAIKTNAKFTEAYTFRGMIRGLLKDHQGAIQDYNLALKTTNDSQLFANIYNSRGISRVVLGDKQEAIKDFSQAIKLEPKQTIYWRNRGSASADLTDLSAALVNYNIAIQLEPFEAELYQIRGELNLKKGDIISGIKDIKTAMRLRIKKEN